MIRLAFRAFFVLAVSAGAAPLQAAPAVFSFTPQSGPPGTSVMVSGAGLSGVTALFFNNSAALFTILDDNDLAATVPNGATSGPLVFSSATGTFSTSSYFWLPPTVSDFNPTEAAPGESVRITGANFDGALAVWFGQTPAHQFYLVAPTQIQAVVPAGAQSGPIRVFTPIGASASTNLLIVTGAGPVISDFAPKSGPPGTAVTISGLRFVGTTAVFFGGAPAASFSIVADSQIQATVPSGSTGGVIRVVSPAGAGVSAASFAVASGPSIDSFSPASGAPGTAVVISGANFTQVTAVEFNGVAAKFSVVADTQIQATVPAQAKNGPIEIVTAAGSASSSASFTVSAAPEIDSFEPAEGPAGTSVVIRGLRFSGASAVLFGGANAPDFSAVSDTQITAIAPAGAMTGPITVVTRFGAASSPGDFVVSRGAPLIQSFQPLGGGPGTAVTVVGANFFAVTNVLFGGLPAAQFTVTAPTQLQAVAPDGGATGPIVVQTPSGEGVSSNPFFYPAQIASFSPTNGVAGTAVDIYGTNFASLAGVRFQGAAAVFAAHGSNWITAIVPDAAVTGNISVENPAGLAASTNLFLVRPQILSFQPLAGPPGVSVFVHGSGFDQISVLEFGGAPADFVVLSPTEIQTRLPAAARSGPISLAGAYGQAASAASFVVGESADLQVTLVIRRNRGSSLVLAWPLAGSNLVLQSSDRVEAGWSALAAALTQSDTENRVAIAATNRARFFRLRSK